jgi:hypothetical protein
MKLKLPLTSGQQKMQQDAFKDPVREPEVEKHQEIQENRMIGEQPGQRQDLD